MAITCPVDLDTVKLRHEIQAIYARVATEQTVPRPVMPPAEVELLLSDFIGELTTLDVPEAAERLPRYVGLLNGFLFDWRQVYLLHGENPAAQGQYATGPAAGDVDQLATFTDGFRFQCGVDWHLLPRRIRGS